MDRRRILCMQHCSKDVNVFSFDVVPERCPMCWKDIADQVLPMPPFHLPFPFRHARDCPCSLVIKPSKGSFLRDYANATDLHIGVTDSNGATYEYDVNGLTITSGEIHQDPGMVLEVEGEGEVSAPGGGDQGKKPSWSECLPVFISPDRRTPSTNSNRPVCPLWKERWDAAITAVAEETHWTKDRYNPESHNCFSFVLEFLRCLEVDSWSSYLRNKTSLCSAFILPVTTLAGKYISLYRQLLEQEYVMLVSG